MEPVAFRHVPTVLALITKERENAELQIQFKGQISALYSRILEAHRTEGAFKQRLPNIQIIQVTQLNGRWFWLSAQRWAFHLAGYLEQSMEKVFRGTCRRVYLSMLHCQGTKTYNNRIAFPVNLPINSRTPFQANLLKDTNRGADCRTGSDSSLPLPFSSVSFDGTLWSLKMEVLFTRLYFSRLRYSCAKKSKSKDCTSNRKQHQKSYLSTAQHSA